MRCVQKSFGKYGINIEGCSIDVKKMQNAKEKSVSSLTGGIEMLFKKNGVDWIKGHGTFEGENSIRINNESDQTKSQTITADNIVIASGSDYKSLPGIKIDEKNILSSTGMLTLQEVPESITIIGAGVIGLEMGSVWSRLGSKVTVVEFLDRIAPGLDGQVAAEFTKILKKQGMAFKFGTAVQKVLDTGAGVEVHVEDKANAKSVLKSEKVLVSVGRKAFFDGLGVEKIGVQLEHGMIKTDESLRTNVPHIYAIGDVTKGPQLAHKSEEEGVAVAEMIAGASAYLNYDAIPSVVYTNPEVASVGKTEEELKKAKISYNKGVFPFVANSRARTVDEFEGFVKTLSDKKTDKILGVHIIGEQAGELIHECCLAMNYGGSSEDIARTCHAHPTRSEALKESALATFDKAIHF